MEKRVNKRTSTFRSPAAALKREKQRTSGSLRIWVPSVSVTALAGRVTLASQESWRLCVLGMDLWTRLIGLTVGGLQFEVVVCEFFIVFCLTGMCLRFCRGASIGTRAYVLLFWFLFVLLSDF